MKFEFTENDGLVLQGNRLFIPAKLRQKALTIRASRSFWNYVLLLWCLNSMRLNIGKKIPGVFFNWDSLNAWLNNHYKVWSYKKKKHKKVKAYRKYV